MTVKFTYAGVVSTLALVIAVIALMWAVHDGDNKKHHHHGHYGHTYPGQVQPWPMPYGGYGFDAVPPSSGIPYGNDTPLVSPTAPSAPEEMPDDSSTSSQESVPQVGTSR